MIEPKILVVVPVYNASQYLPKCIESILSQSFQDFQLILVNDGSTDDSLDICKKYEKFDDRIIVMSQTNGGVSKARNRGLDFAKGEWITFVDADDYFLDDALSTLYERAMQTGTDLVLANALKLKDGKSSKLHRLKNEVLPNAIMSIKHFALWGYLFNADIIRKQQLRFIDGLAYSEDRIFIYQMARYCKTIAFCNKPVYVYRINETSACSSQDGVRKACHHLDAAFYLNQIALTYQKTDKPVYNCLHRQSKHLINLGLYLFVETGFSLENLAKIKERYNQRFGCNLKTSFDFYCTALNCLLTFERRKIITFKK